MGSSRMGSDPAKSVVDPDGQSWDVAGNTVCECITCDCIELERSTCGEGEAHPGVVLLQATLNSSRIAG